VSGVGELDLKKEKRGKNEDELVESESGVRSVEKQLSL
jgi:hypothetical protein